MDLQLNGKRALVTGGSRGIGKAIARVLAQEGCDVALLARNEAALSAAAAELAAASGRRVVGVRGDTTSDEQVTAAVADAVQPTGRHDRHPGQRGGRARGLCSAAAAGRHHRRVLPRRARHQGDGLHPLRARSRARHARAGWGRIVNISGLAARQTGNAVGSMRNVAVSALTKNLADELGPHGINVTVVHPGLTRTERTAPLVAARAQAQGVPPQAVEAQMAAGNSIQHLVDASEVADVVAFLCSPRSGAVNGDVIAAGGGAPRSIHY